MTGADVAKMFELTGEKAESCKWRYPAGQQFVEFLHLRLNGTGNKSTIRQLGTIVAELARTYKQVRDVFPKYFGVTLTDAQRQFIEFITATEKKPEERFDRTMLMPKEPGAPDM